CILLTLMITNGDKTDFAYDFLHNDVKVYSFAKSVGVKDNRLFANKCIGKKAKVKIQHQIGKKIKTSKVLQYKSIDFLPEEKKSNNWDTAGCVRVNNRTKEDEEFLSN